MSKDPDFDDMTIHTCMLEILEMSEAIHCKHSDVMNIANRQKTWNFWPQNLVPLPQMIASGIPLLAEQHFQLFNDYDVIMCFKGALYRIQILCRRYTFWSYPARLTIADPPGKQKLKYRRVYSHHFQTTIAESIHTTPNSIQCPFNQLRMCINHHQYIIVPLMIMRSQYEYTKFDLRIP